MSGWSGAGHARNSVQYYSMPARGAVSLITMPFFFFFESFEVNESDRNDFEKSKFKVKKRKDLVALRIFILIYILYFFTFILCFCSY